MKKNKKQKGVDYAVAVTPQLQAKMGENWEWDTKQLTQRALELHDENPNARFSEMRHRVIFKNGGAGEIAIISDRKELKVLMGLGDEVPPLPTRKTQKTWTLTDEQWELITKTFREP